MKNKIPKKYIDGFFNRENEMYHDINDHIKESFWEQDRINEIAVALTHYLFRNGAVEEMHSDGKLSDHDMKLLNQFMANRLAGLLVMIHSNRWLELEAMLQHHRFVGNGWDTPDPDTSDFDKIWNLLYSSLKLED